MATHVTLVCTCILAVLNQCSLYAGEMQYQQALSIPKQNSWRTCGKVLVEELVLSTEVVV